jgi:YVTN family beta-propeller protein
MGVAKKPLLPWAAVVLVLFATANTAGPMPALAETVILGHVATISLGTVQGRIDHFAVDVANGRLFVAELGNDSVSVIDLNDGAVIQRVAGLPKPQGLAYVPATDTLYVATGNDGLLRMYAAADMSLEGTIAIGLDPDNVHANADGSVVAVGFSDGLAVIDTASGQISHSITLSGHVEGFQFDGSGQRVIANIADTYEIAVIDVASGVVVDRWPTDERGANFPLAVDDGAVLAGYRAPASLGIYALEDGTHLATMPLCRDSDDLAIDPARRLVYAICGDGQIMIFSHLPGERNYQMVGQTPTTPGARTGLFVPSLDRLFVAVRAQAGEPAGIWVFAPTN